MNTAHQSTNETLLSLKEASQRLNVSIDTLILWNQHNILKPTITKEGVVGYTEHQLTQFVIMRNLMLENATPAPVTPQHPQQQETLSYENKPHVTINEQHKTHGKKYFSSQIIASVAIIVVIIAIATFPKPSDLAITSSGQDQRVNEHVLSANTSRLPLKEKMSSLLPIQLQQERSQKKSVQDEGARISEAKIIAPALYASTLALEEQSEYIATASVQEEPSGIAGIDENEFADTYASQVNNQTTDENAAIDENGNIRGTATAATVESIATSIDQLIKSDAFKQANTQATNQLLLLSLGAAFALLFAFQRQLAFIPQTRRPLDSYYPQTTLPSQKALELDQKTDGTVVFYFKGKEYKVSKPEMNSESDQFIEKLMMLTGAAKKELEYDIFASDAIRFTTPLSRLVTRLGFVGIKRDLFFPRTSKTSVFFRRYLTDSDLIAMNVTPEQITQELTKLS